MATGHKLIKYILEIIWSIGNICDELFEFISTGYTIYTWFERPLTCKM